MEKLAVIGLGLIGSSLGLALKQRKMQDIQLVGYDKDYKVAAVSVKRGAVDLASRTLEEAVEDAALVVVATPVMAMREVFLQMASHLAPEAIVTDMGSTKQAVLQWAQEYLPSSVNFVGGHPMAGKEVSGPENADANLFSGAVYAVVPGASASPDAVGTVVSLVEFIGAKPFFPVASEHDILAAAVSHVPILLSTALVQATTQSPSWSEMSKLASTGYRDVSRLASGDPVMNRDICITNKEGVVAWVDKVILSLYELRRLVLEDGDALEKTFFDVYTAREKWVNGIAPREEKGTSSMSEIPSAGEQMEALFLGERLAKRRRELMQRMEKGDVKGGKGK